MSYKKIPCNEDKTTKQRRPLMIGSSGGSGHIIAIQGLRNYFEIRYGKEINFPQYNPVLYSQKPESPLRKKIEIRAGIKFSSTFRGFIKALVYLTCFPVLPDRKRILDSEIAELQAKEKDKTRFYIDMLLDVYPMGYEVAAICNILHRYDKFAEIINVFYLIEQDFDHYHNPRSYFFNLLIKSAKQGDPYTEVVSTQYLALPAVCDAVREYSEWLIKNPKIKAPQVIIHQYMTDLPTEAVPSILDMYSSLSSEQQQYMNLYAVGLNKNMINYYFPDGGHFNGVHNINPKRNPIIRPGFKDPVLDNSLKFKELTVITLADQKKPFIIQPNEQIASILLGSQVTESTIEYTKIMLKTCINKIFVFGGEKPVVQRKIKNILKIHPEYEHRIVPLNNQGDREIASLMSRSNIVIIRSGGLSVMEQMAMNHNPQQAVFIHQAHSSKEGLTSGLYWEDQNASNLISHLRKKDVHIEKITPKKAARQIAEAQLIAAIKRLQAKLNTNDVTQFIKKLPTTKLNLCLNQFNESKKIPKELTVFFLKCESEANTLAGLLHNKLKLAEHYLEQTISLELNKLGTMDQYLIEANNPLILFQYNIDQIIKDSQNELFNDAQPELYRAINNYQAIQKLEHIVDECQTPNTKLEKFLKEYKQIRRGLVLNCDIVLTQLTQEIECYLAPFEHLSIKYVIKLTLRMIRLFMLKLHFISYKSYK